MLTPADWMLTGPDDGFGKTLNETLPRSIGSSTAAGESHPIGHAPITSQSGSRAQGESSRMVSSSAFGSQKIGSSEMFPLTPYCEAIASIQSPLTFPHRSRRE